MKELAGVILIGIFVAAWMTRWEVIAGSGTDQAAVVHFKLNRFSGATYGFMVGHVAPEAARGGPIGLLRDGDTITIDVDARRVHTDADLESRRADWKPRPHAYPSGALAKYAFMVSSASEGAVTSFPDLDAQGSEQPRPE